MKHFLTILLLVAATLVQAQNPNLEKILANSNTGIYEVPKLMTDQNITVENYTNATTSFIVLCFSASDQWSFLTVTPELLPYKVAHGNGFITANSYKYQYRESLRMENRESFKRPISKLAILAASHEKYSIRVIENGYNLILKIYPLDSDGYIAPVNNPYENDSIANMVFSSEEEKVKIDSRLYIRRVGNTYVYNNMVYNKNGIQSQLAKLSPAAYNQFSSGYRLGRAGWGLFIPGTILDIIGGALLGSGSTTTKYKGGVSNDSKTIAGAVMIGIGGLFTSIGVTCICFGYNKMHTAAEIYNVKVEAKEEIKLSLTTSGNGAGLALTW